ncbi:nucleotidyl transferase AbiEii/AbiGii toxin family protein [Mesoterricola sediminis]|uniref:Nucleotidyl transferase AbiEii/AbiGii toxin family protein n=1 Tax=Mesoterricola sediminis TaxID=2927980 RepID=A0AA48GX27_9BACT|nr:nucleotidyl transferase AbiEii/AbiGii toxin family protein [Mesoterricola sediminis]BDU75990.1 hypothetical protein METESE_09480 [Mesoterricola sediminis]
MRLSVERLMKEAEATGFRPESLEKVIRLISLLNHIFQDPFLRDRLALKGGTALNLFLFDIPRLSVDIDLNYIGAEDKEDMQAERPGLEARLRSIFEKDDFTIRKAPSDHAGGKWQLRYAGAQGQGGSLEVDLNFLHRVPLESPQWLDSRDLGSFQAKNVRVMGLHDLAAGKLIALLDRTAARDIVDAARLFDQPGLDLERLRLPFVIVGAASRALDLRTATPESADPAGDEFDRMVRPLLRASDVQPDPATQLEKARSGLRRLLPVRGHESEFIRAIWEEGEIHPEWLTSDPDLQRRIASSPLLRWKTLNVKRHRDLKG